MANRPATVHWEIADRIIWHVAAGRTNEEAILITAGEYKTTPLTTEDLLKIADAIDNLSVQYQPPGYWYRLVLEGFMPNVRLGLGLPPVETGVRMPRWGWALLAFFGGYALYKMTR